MTELWTPDRKLWTPDGKPNPDEWGMQAGILLRGAVYTPQGKLLEESIVPGHSFVVAFPTILLWSMAGRSGSAVTAPTLQDMANTTRTLGTAVSGEQSIGNQTSVTTDTEGIVVGTSSTAVTATDYKLGTAIAHGSGAGQLNYGHQFFGGTVPSGTGSKYVNVLRLFQNNSGSPITINEVGLLTRSGTTAGSQKFLIAHDLLTINVTNGNIAAVQYQLVFNLT